MERNISCKSICSKLGLNYMGEDTLLNGLNFCDRKSQYKRILSYVTNDDYVNEVRDRGNIVCLVLGKEALKSYSMKTLGREISYILSDSPEEIFYEIHEYLFRETDFYENYDFPCQIGNSCNIDSSALIQNGVVIGNNVTIGPLSVIKRGTIIDDNCEIGCGSIIGSEGFQVLTVWNGMRIHAPHVGCCHLCKNVYVGDNTCICKSLFEGETVIGQGSKIDNLVQIGHNCKIGSDCVITAQVMLCGSVSVSDHTWIAPNVSVLNRVEIGENVKVGIGSVVTRNVRDGVVVYGVPAKEKETSKREEQKEC